MTVQGPRKETATRRTVTRGGGIEVRNFPHFFRNCFWLVPLVRVLVPCVSLCRGVAL